MTDRSSGILEAAISLAVASDKATRAGDLTSPVHDRLAAVSKKAVAAGYSTRDIHSEADRRYGRWLIDNAGKD